MTHVTTLPDQARKALRAAMEGCADEKTKIPALRGVLVRTTPRGMLEFTGTDLARVERAECGAKVEAALECVIAHPRDLAQWLALADKSAVTLTIEQTDKGERLTVAQPGNVARFATFSVREYPMHVATKAAASTSAAIPQPDKVTKWLPDDLDGEAKAERREHYGALHIVAGSGARWQIVHTATSGFITTCDSKARAARLAAHMAHSGINWDSARIVPMGDGKTRIELDGASMTIVGKMNRAEIESGAVHPQPQPVAAVEAVTPPQPQPQPQPAAQPVKLRRAERAPRTVDPVRLAEVAYNGRIYRDCEVEIVGARAQCLIGARAVNVPLSAIRWQ